MYLTRKQIENRLDILFPEIKFSVYPCPQQVLIYNIAGWGEGFDIFNIYIDTKEIKNNQGCNIDKFLTYRICNHLRTIKDTCDDVLKRNNL